MAKSLLLPGILVLAMIIVAISANGRFDHGRGRPDHGHRRPYYTCANVKCISGFKCEMQHSRPVCVRQGETGTTPSDDSSASEEDDDLNCGTPSCPSDTFCRWDRVDCFKAPCPQPEPKCIAKPTPPPPTCDNVNCPSGQVCEQPATNCYGDGCPPPPQPKCVPYHGGCGYCPPGRPCARPLICFN